MGASISKAIEDLDGGADAEKQMQDTLISLYQLGLSRAAGAYSKATNNNDKRLAPVALVIMQEQSIVINASADTKDVVDGLKGSVGDLIKGQVLDGVTKLIQHRLNVVLGSAPSQVKSSYQYGIIATPLGGLLRFDVDTYYFELRSQGLQSRAKNMATVSAVISTIDVTQITLSSLRAIVSTTFGNSDIAEQREIFAVVENAWRLDQKNLKGEPITTQERDEHKALFLPSKVEQEAAEIEKRLPASLQEKPKMTRQDVMTRMNDLQNLAEDDENAAWADCPLWILLTKPPIRDWFTYMQGALSGFNIDGACRFGKASGPRSGRVVTFDCQIRKHPVEVFQWCLDYINETVLPDLRGARYLNDYIDSISLQYNQPDATGDGSMTIIDFQNNPITNTTNDIITFHFENRKTQAIEVKPDEPKTLTGKVSYISTAKSPETKSINAANGVEPDEHPKAPPEGDVSAQEGPAANSWVTYQSIQPEQILTGMSMTLVPGSVRGYLLKFHGPKDQLLTIAYTTLWPNTSIPSDGQ